MAWRNRFDRTYTVNTSLSKSAIVSTFKARIEEALKDKSWFTINGINYKKIQVDEFRAVIKLSRFFSRQIGEIGIVILHFETIDDGTAIQAVVKPAAMVLWIIPVLMVFFGVFLFWLIPGFDKYILIVLAWAMILIPCYISIAIGRYKLTRYLKLVLKDIGVGETLNPLSNYK